MINSKRSGDGILKTKPGTWDEIYARLDEWKRYHAGVCAKCGENIRMQGETMCLECLEEREDMEHLMEMSL